MGDLTAFAPWLDRWGLTLDGEPFETHYNRNVLVHVRRAGEPAILKITSAEHEMAGGAVMAWLDGDGAARVLAREGGALLLERLPATRSLKDMARAGGDDEASRIICAVGDRLHAPRAQPPPATVIPLARWFRALAPAADAHGGIFKVSLAAAQALFADPRDVVVLHGDLHHENVIDGGPRGWLVIDPKGILGERTYEYATTLCNPDPEVAQRPGRLARQIEVIADAARLDPRRLLHWTLAHAGISAAWCMADGFDPAPALALAGIAKGLAEAG